MHTPRPAASCAVSRCGLLSLELVLTLPVVTLLLLGLIEFACLWQGHCAVTDATTAGVREATRLGALENDVCEAVHRALDNRLSADAEITFEPAPAEQTQSVCRVRVPMSACAPNLLWPIGFDLEGRYVVCAVETPQN